jgi:hypothetical protein
MMSFTRNLVTPLVSRRLFSTTVNNAYYTSSLLSDQHKKVDPKAKLYDFRSDTVTAPTDEMFDIMKSASRSDDVFQVSVKKKTKVTYL